MFLLTTHKNSHPVSFFGYNIWLKIFFCLESNQGVIPLFVFAYAIKYSNNKTPAGQKKGMMPPQNGGQMGAAGYYTVDRRHQGRMTGEFGPQYDEIPYGDVAPGGGDAVARPVQNGGAAVAEAQGNSSGKGKLPEVPSEYSQVPQVPARQGKEYELKKTGGESAAARRRPRPLRSPLLFLSVLESTASNFFSSISSFPYSTIKYVSFREIFLHIFLYPACCFDHLSFYSLRPSRNFYNV